LAVGSTNIDKAFNELVESRLSHLGCIVNNAALGKEFQAVKTKLGTSTVDLLDDFEIPIPGLAKNIKDDTARASKGCMIFSR